VFALQRRSRGHNILLCRPNLKFSSRIDQVRCTYKAVRNLGFLIGKHKRLFKDELRLETMTYIFLNLLSVRYSIIGRQYNIVYSMDPFENRFNWITQPCSGTTLFYVTSDTNDRDWWSFPCLVNTLCTPKQISKKAST